VITKDTLQEFFENTRKLRDTGEAPFDIDTVCRWSFFFIDSDKKKLTKLGLHLEDNGYEIIGFLEPSPDDEDQETIFLRADRVEQHSVESLHARNLELYKVAEQFNIQDYDGMDVGAIDSP
jgi:hypothetical protein